jgi:hypothetical protein
MYVISCVAKHGTNFRLQYPFIQDGVTARVWKAEEQRTAAEHGETTPEMLKTLHVIIHQAFTVN